MPIARVFCGVMNDQLAGMVCPRCGSDDWRSVPWWSTFIVGIGTAGCGIWLVLILIGIPIVIIGLLLAAAAPFIGSFYMCNRCRKTWKVRP